MLTAPSSLQSSGVLSTRRPRYTGARNFGPEPSEPRVHSTYSTLIGINDTWTTVFRMGNMSKVVRQLSKERTRLTDELYRVTAALTAFGKVYLSGSNPKAAANHTKRTISAAGRKRIAEAQRAGMCAVFSYEDFRESLIAIGWKTLNACLSPNPIVSLRAWHRTVPNSLL